MIKKCPRCGRLMKKIKDDSSFQCTCGNAWEKGKGFYQINKIGSKPKEESCKKPAIIEDEKTVTAIKPKRTIRKSVENVYGDKKSAEDIIRGGIYYIKRHTTEGHEQHSGRPGVVISDISEGDYDKIVTIVYLTSREKQKTKTRTLMTSSGIVATALCEQITCVDIGRVGKLMGFATPDEMAAIKKCVATHLGMMNDTYYFSTKDDKDKLIARLQAKIKAMQRQLEEYT